ncbi:MAG: DUF116 domain-containing protein [Candidatus Sumerlaeia bacterium]|nr:DUF116 domain-containing protein [Candidatus Sumerlaeia bacterium]
MIKERTRERPDRKLGHEWLEWEEAKAWKFPADTTTSPLLWVVVTLFSLLVGWIVIAGVLMKVSILIRLGEAGKGIINTALLILVVLIIAYFMFLLLGYWLKKDLAFFLRFRVFFARLTFLLGRFYHWTGLLSRDRLDNSFLQLLNLFENKRKYYSGLKAEKGGGLLLMPRCIEANLRQKIIQRAQEYGISWALAGDGEMARVAVQKHQPGAILAIACERDLITGIRDVSQQIPILTLSVKRPQGPCKDTFVDFYVVEEYLIKLKSKVTQVE